MAREPDKKDDRRDRARGMYDNDRSVKIREERDSKPDEKPEPKKEPTKAGDHTEGGEPRRKPGEAKPRDGMAAMMGGHKAERAEMAMRHEKERLAHHGMERSEHREMSERHEGEMSAMRHAA